eukprot:CAMPEP_0195508308 /NCGR_PEP_ID=MMETSP0794_2-20130614/1546_1 /TAXON_ID=515487 /ORGANISM="Stephanopyxis turris, Strain CCMP 815" /LENGTH=205 /DNA_ID=CAMNT_0040635227 /DNA_START=50 /DNA_END=667 /DNA_ORIENTATION=+
MDEERCPDGHRCTYGSKCVEDELDEGNYYCDCDAAGMDGIYVGLYCEHKATEFCTSVTDPSTKRFFCTNYGDCVRGKDENGQTSFGCACKSDYVGEHCQFIKGSYTEQPKASSPVGSTYGTNQSSRGSNGALTFLIVSMCIAMIAGLALLAKIAVRKRSAARHIRSAGGEGMVLQHDGMPTIDEGAIAGSTKTAEFSDNDEAEII